MKREHAFILSSTVTGMVMAFVLIGILMAIAIPNYSNYIISQEMKASADHAYENVQFIGEHTNWFLSILLPFLALTFAFFVKVINPSLTFNTFKQKPGRYKAPIVVLALAAGYIFLFIFGSSSGLALINLSPLQIVVIVVINAFMWLFAGQMGWAGDFSSWRDETTFDKSALMNITLLGALTGALACGLLIFILWAFEQYFLLVSEVLDRSSETSPLGFKFFFIGLSFLFTFGFAITASIVSALAPVGRRTMDRLRMMILPLVLSVVFVGTVMGVYINACNKYDLNKDGLASVLGVPDAATESLTVVSFGSEPNVSPWPLELNVNGFVNNYSVAISQDTIDKASGYVDAHPEGSIFYYPALNVQWQGPLVLWDIDEATVWMSRYSRQLLMPSLIMTTKAMYMPVTEQNIEMLRAFTDENIWSVSGTYALKLAEGFAHFGLFDEARLWRDRAVKDGVSVPDTFDLDSPTLTDGSITGKITINGEAAKGMKVALMSDFEDDEINVFILMRRLLDTVHTDAHGAFSFDNLGAGQYRIVLVTDDSVIPSDIKPYALDVRNPPEVISLELSNGKIDLGVIGVSF